MNAPITLHKLAEQLELSISTVSCCLRNDPRFSKATREKVIKTAEQLGYRPDPMLSALASYRDSRRRRTTRASLAWLHPNLEKQYLTIRHLLWATISGARKRALDFGYSITEFSAAEYGSAEKLEAILHARGIEGIILFADGPQTSGEITLPANLDNLSVIVINYEKNKQRFHTVAPHYFNSALTAFNELERRGSQHIGLALFNDHDAYTHHLIHAALTYRHQTQRQRKFLPAFICQHNCESPEAVDLFNRWMKKHRPDAILTDTWNTIAHLLKLGLSIPDDVNIALTQTAHASAKGSGIFENAELLGARAIEQLVNQIRRREFGVPDSIQHILVEGSWVEGTSTSPIENLSAEESKRRAAEQNHLLQLPLPPHSSWNPGSLLPDVGYGAGVPCPVPEAFRKQFTRHQHPRTQAG